MGRHNILEVPYWRLYELHYIDNCSHPLSKSIRLYHWCGEDKIVDLDLNGWMRGTWMDGYPWECRYCYKVPPQVIKTYLFFTYNIGVPSEEDYNKTSSSVHDVSDS
jgi:hypothetical protein